MPQPTTNNLNNWEKEFDKEFDDYKLDSESQGVETIRNNIKQFISDLMRKDKETPMGVSQWAEYGKRYGYWDYFKNN
jgi:hypothetical protein